MKFADYLKTVNLLVATPMYGGVCYSDYVVGLLDLYHQAQQVGMRLGYRTLGNESLINRARNTLAAYFYASGATHMLWVDADVGFKGMDVIRLLAAAEDLVCGAYPLKTTRVAPDTYATKPKEGQALRVKEHPMGGKIVEIDRPATGFMLVSRACIAKMYDAYREQLGYVNRLNELEGMNVVGLFECAIVEEKGERHLLSEDYAFGRRWTDLGGTVWLDPQIQLTHTGTHCFTAPPIGQWLQIQ